MQAFVKVLSVALCSVFINMTHAQTVIELYNGTIPNSVPCDKKEITLTTAPNHTVVSGITVPTLTAFFPEQKDSFKTAVIICPGGGYTRLAIEHEGYAVARELNKRGVTAFVLKNRVPADAECMTNKEIVPLEDVERAIKIVRDRAKEFDISTDKVGVMGFSAGGHVASTIGTHFNTVVIDNASNTNLRPDFLILGYPVISFTDSLGHRGSRDNMLGKNPPLDKIILYSNELQVTKETPPTFLVHASDDHTVNVENSIAFFEALQKNKVATELHIYQRGGHGFGLHNPTTKDFWLDRAVNWLVSNRLLKGDRMAL